MQADWSLLNKELVLWANAGHKPRLWLRDDDAVSPSAALDRLLVQCERYEVPIVLAVIPEPTGQELAQRLKDIDFTRIAVHGWRHANHALPSEKKQELGAHRPMPEILSELSRGFAKLSELHRGQFLPMLVPPWNRIDAGLLPHLPDIGFRLVSSFAENLAKQSSGYPRVINTHLDIMDWATRRGRDHAELTANFAAELRKSRESGFYPVGILTHHAVHDEQAWDFLAQLLEMTALGNSCEWLTGDALLRA
jgi:hypothetical protein